MMLCLVIGVLIVWATPTTGDNLITRIRPHVRATMSSQWINFDAYKAIDGNDTPDPSNCNCCSGTNDQSYGSSPVWFRLDLGNYYLIKTIIVTGRDDGARFQTQNFTIYDKFQDQVAPIYENYAYGSQYNFTIHLNSSVFLRYLEITKSDTKALTICEIKLIEEENLIQKINRFVNTSQVSTYSGFTSDKAIDNVDTPMPNTCNCCSCTNTRPNSWWRISLGNNYPVESIIFIGRNDSASYQSRGFSVYDTFTSLPNSVSPIYVNNDTTATGYEYLIQFHPPRVLQRLEFRHPLEIAICELRIVESNLCPAGLFGKHCEQKCHCNDIQQCNRTNGKCQSPGCLPGWRGLSCSNKVCEQGTFGQNCSFYCRCFDNQTCNDIDGRCPGDTCAPGWRETNCSIACIQGTFGHNCSFPCHCSSGQMCDHINGSCPAGVHCSIGWKGGNCSIDTNVIKHIRPSVRVSSSQPHWNIWTADKAIDFIESSDPYACDCCSGSTYRNAWWRIDFGDTYPITTIDFTGRNDGASYQSRGFSVYDDFKNRTLNRSLIYKNNATSGYHFVILFQPPRILQYVEIASPEVLSICEIRFIESERCPPGYFGKHCMEHCHCNDSLACERSTGFCQHQGCTPGFQGDSCNKTCDWGFYGIACASQCHCLNNVSCDSASGNCSNEACAPGWQGLPTCSEECDWGSFGYRCAQHCHCNENASCDNVNGICSNGACSPGWRTNSCSKVCDWGSFGIGCSTHCYCYDNVSCDNVKGTCSNGACAAGWQGLSCSEACGSGTFGENCSTQCHCLHNQECDHISGVCPSDACAPGWQYKDCSAVCDGGKFGGSCMSNCHCLDGRPCHHIDGSCKPELCAPGWWGYNCSIACVNNTYGQNCNSTCHCDSCHHISGSCDTRTCYSQWTGINCNVSAEPLTQDEPDSSPAVIIGPVVVVAVLVAVAAAFLFYRRHTRARKSNGTIRYKHGPESEQQDGLSVNHTYKNASFDEHVLADEDVYHDINDVGPTEGIAVKQLWYHVQSLYQNDSQKLTQEFQSFHTNVLDQIAKAKRSRGKNDTQMANAERIQVALTDEKSVQHYQYDANYIDGYDKSQKYIAAKGPSSKTEINAFWEMIYQANVSLILMLQESKPQDKKEMIQYWAAEGDAVYGNITVKTIKFTTDTDFIIRQFEAIKANQQRRQVTQIQCNGFVANILPCTLTRFINFWRESIRMSGSGPLLVHGSSGDGSVGLYMALDVLYAQATAEKYVNPGEITTQICSQRGSLIQTKEQYGLLYEALAEALHIRARPISAKEFPSFVAALREEDSLKRQSGIVLQYETLFGSDSEYFGLQQMQKEHEYSSLSLSSKPRSHSEVPALPVRSTAKPLLINLQNFANQNAFILTSVDDEITNCQLWKTIDKRKIKTIISLDTKATIMNLTKEDSSTENTIYSVRSMESKKENGCFINAYAYKRRNEIEAEVKSVTSFHFLEWGGEDTLPKTVESVKTFANAIKRCQPEITEEHPVLLISRSDMNKLGIFYIVLSEFERIRQIEEVNIIEAALRLKEGHSNLTPSFEAYQFCHTVILDFIADSTEYASV